MWAAWFKVEQTDGRSWSYNSRGSCSTDKERNSGKVARIYDPLGLIPPITLQGKLLYRDAFDEKRAWDAPLSIPREKQWQKWERSLLQHVTCPRALTSIQEPIEDIKLHAFGDMSGKGVATSVYAVIKQSSAINQGLVTAKARLAKEGLTIPRRELVSGHMAVNLLTNVQDALQGFPVTSVNCSVLFQISSFCTNCN